MSPSSIETQFANIKKLRRIWTLCIGLIFSASSVSATDLPLDSFPVPNSTDRLELHSNAAGDVILRQKDEESGVRRDISVLGAYPIQTQPVFSADGSAFVITWGSRSAGTDAVFFIRRDGHFVRLGAGKEPNPFRYLAKAAASGVVSKAVMQSVNHLYVRILGWKPDGTTIRLLVEGDGDLDSFCAEENIIEHEVTCRVATKNDVAPYQPIVTAFSKVAGAGTGWLASPSGLVLTCAHVVWGGDRVRIDHQGHSYFARILLVDRDRDIALLRIESPAKFPFLPLGDSNEVGLGAKCFTVGFPMTIFQGFSPRFTDGTISSLSGIDDKPWWFQISVPLQPGNSGGALITEDGLSIGMVASIMAPPAGARNQGPAPQNVNFAVKSSSIIASAAKEKIDLPKVPPRKLTREEAIRLATDAAVRLVIYKTDE